MSEPVFGEARYLVLHFQGGKLSSTKVTHSWRGAQMSKRNHERMYGVATRIIPIDAILAIKGLEAPETELSVEDMELLRRMGIA